MTSDYHPEAHIPTTEWGYYQHLVPASWHDFRDDVSVHSGENDLRPSTD